MFSSLILQNKSPEWSCWSHIRPPTPTAWFESNQTPDTASGCICSADSKRALLPNNWWVQSNGLCCVFHLATALSSREGKSSKSSVFCTDSPITEVNDIFTVSDRPEGVCSGWEGCESTPVVQWSCPSSCDFWLTSQKTTTDSNNQHWRLLFCYVTINHLLIFWSELRSLFLLLWAARNPRLCQLQL